VRSPVRQGAEGRRLSAYSTALLHSVSSCREWIRAAAAATACSHYSRSGLVDRVSPEGGQGSGVTG
jgi:hypothetical protein